jgi:hypothetical protein
LDEGSFSPAKTGVDNFGAGHFFGASKLTNILDQLPEILVAEKTFITAESDFRESAMLLPTDAKLLTVLAYGQNSAHESPRNRNCRARSRPSAFGNG